MTTRLVVPILTSYAGMGPTVRPPLCKREILGSNPSASTNLTWRALMVFVVIAFAFAVMILATFACAQMHEPRGISIMPFLRKTFVPLTQREFWFPPCPMCWAVRVATVALAVYVFLPYLSVAQAG